MSSDFLVGLALMAFAAVVIFIFAAWLFQVTWGIFMVAAFSLPGLSLTESAAGIGFLFIVRLILFGFKKNQLELKDPQEYVPQNGKKK